MQILLKTGETWLICGGRHFADTEAFTAIMRQLAETFGLPRRVVHGACPTGADKMAESWATRLALEIHAEPADWKQHGLAAGPIRNQLMLDKYHPHKVVAFPGGRGTADMIRRAKALGS